MNEKDMEILARRIKEALKSALPEHRETRDPSVRILHTNKLSIVVVDQIFEGMDYPQRDAWLGNALDKFAEEELNQINDWRMFSINEAKKVFPDWLGAKSA